jgi:carbon monoxide dehydrogenase subunit G
MAMELDHSFTVPVPPDQAWDVLLDVERIAPCMPGATVDEVDGDVVNGRIKVKVGPVSLTYKGTAKFIERDPDARVAVVEASGKETRGAGTASATVRASMVPDPSGSGTQVSMHTTMNVTGRPAQFGRGVIVEVGGKLVEQFAANLAQLITGDTGATASAGSGGDAPGGVPAGTSAAGTSAAGTSGGGTSAAGTSGGGTSGGGTSTAGTSGGGVDGASAPTATLDAEAGNGSGGAAASTAAGSVASSSAPAQENSLNLVKLAGPVILKRVVPVAVGAAALALLSRLFWRLRRRPGRAKKA